VEALVDHQAEKATPEVKNTTTPDVVNESRIPQLAKRMTSTDSIILSEDRPDRITPPVKRMTSTGSTMLSDDHTLPKFDLSPFGSPVNDGSAPNLGETRSSSMVQTPTPFASPVIGFLRTGESRASAEFRQRKAKTSARKYSLIDESYTMEDLLVDNLPDLAHEPENVNIQTIRQQYTDAFFYSSQTSISKAS
jgi:hypothetical protein